MNEKISCYLKQSFEHAFVLGNKPNNTAIAHDFAHWYFKQGYDDQGEYNIAGIESVLAPGWYVYQLMDRIIVPDDCREGIAIAQKLLSTADVQEVRIVKTIMKNYYTEPLLWCSIGDEQQDINCSPQDHVFSDLF